VAAPVVVRWAGLVVVEPVVVEAVDEEVGSCVRVAAVPVPATPGLCA